MTDRIDRSMRSDKPSICRMCGISKPSGRTLPLPDLGADGLMIENVGAQEIVGGPRGAVCTLPVRRAVVVGRNQEPHAGPDVAALGEMRCRARGRSCRGGSRRWWRTRARYSVDLRDADVRGTHIATHKTVGDVDGDRALRPDSRRSQHAPARGAGAAGRMRW